MIKTNIKRCVIPSSLYSKVQVANVEFCEWNASYTYQSLSGICSARVIEIILSDRPSKSAARAQKL